MWGLVCYERMVETHPFTRSRITFARSARETVSYLLVNFKLYFFIKKICLKPLSSDCMTFTSYELNDFYVERE